MLKSYQKSKAKFTKQSHQNSIYEGYTRTE